MNNIVYHLRSVIFTKQLLIMRWSGCCGEHIEAYIVLCLQEYTKVTDRKDNNKSHLLPRGKITNKTRQLSILLLCALNIETRTTRNKVMKGAA